ncbi:MAG: tRNA uridine-5-carboxymethylaminomethyl(34) synthesis GTPase MnmE [Myxococcales bacterium]|nr:tRNA uridine-5-carboxymethylaminomethyl(34) synthesis GTPase MnmE [Myxococcales bacterium]
MSASSTIAAVATPQAMGGLGVVRLSGPLALELALPIAPDVPSPPEPRRAYFTRMVDAQGELLDQGLFLYFRAPHSYTGEEVVELQAHGSPRLMQMLLELLLRGGRARPAEPGEFTRRAFLNRRLDLARAEAVADLVAAESEAQVRAAAAQARGALSEKVRAIRQPLLALQADIEASLDFPEETEGAAAGTRERLELSQKEAAALLSQAGFGRLLRRGARVVLCGPANAGKSTLFNRLLGEERALVDAEPGTTRDALEARLELSGLALTLVDTAGLTEAGGRLEAMGVERTRAALLGADLSVLVLPPWAGAAEAERWAKEAKGPLITVAGKADLGAPAPAGAVSASGLTGEGEAELRAEILRRLVGGRTPEAVALTSERHADALRRAVEALERAHSASLLGAEEAVAGEVGLSVEALGEITGESAPEELLDAIFGRFCLGK